LEQGTHVVGEFSLSDEKIAALIRKIESGESAALIILYEATSRLLFGVIVRILGDRTSAEETLLDVYTQIWKKPTCFAPGISVLEQLVAVARLSALSRLHWTKRDNLKQESTQSAGDSAMTVAPEQQDRARSSLESIPSGQRGLLEWAFYSGLSCDEIAARMGRPAGAVRTHLRLGLGTIGESCEPVTEFEMQERNGGVR
jgi:RNA polymerase sigma-70 factor (ECF subfamily)